MLQLTSLRKKLTALLLLLAPFAASAFDITGTIVDSEGEPMIQASVRLLAARDSSQVKGAVTRDNGSFTISKVDRGRYILEASYVGYATVFQDIRVNRDIKLDTITLAESSIMLKEATVIGIKTPIKVMQDTVEYNADSYKTAPNAVVEDLLKRLPGVDVDSDGKITANGKEVSKILIDGKEFFADDPKVASKNLPVNMVDKLQVVDRKSDLARMTGVDDGEEETVINLTVKKGMNNGWFGTIDGGYGTDSRYAARVNINRFWNGNQFTILGGSNNVNELGFTDGTAGRFMRFGGSTGITRSNSLGINFNVGKEEIFRVGGNVMYSYSDRDTRQSNDRQYLFVDSTSYYTSGKIARDKGHNFRADFRLKWDPDSMNSFEFRPNISLNYNRSASADSSLTRAGDPRMTEVVKSINQNSSRGNAFSMGARLIYNHKFRSRPGRSFSIFANFNMSNTREKSDAYSWNKFFLLDDEIDLTDRFTDNHTWSNSFSSRVSWTEPIGAVAKGNFVTFAYNFSYRWNNADRFTYDHPVAFPEGWDAGPVIDPQLVLNDELTNRFRNDFMNQDIRVGYKHVDKSTNLEAGLSFVPQMSRSINLTHDDKSIPARHVVNYAPYLRYRYRRSKTNSISVDYNGRSSQPSMNQLQPVADKSDPLNIVQGNPDLKPTFNHNVMLRYQNYNPEAQRSIMTMAFFTMTQNSIVSHTTFNPETGGRFTTYENVNGMWNARVMNMLMFPLPNRSFTITNHLMGAYNNSIGWNNADRNRSGSLMLNEMFAFAWRPDNVELELRPRYSLQYVTNSIQVNANRTVHTLGGSFNATYYTPIGIVLNSDLNYTSTSGYSAGYDSREWMWNASISYQFLRDRTATISLKAYDLLQQRSNVRRNVTANYIDDMRFNSLTRYFMISFTYRFNSFGKGNEPQDRNFPGGGPGMGGGRPPMGGGRPPMGGGRPPI